MPAGAENPVRCENKIAIGCRCGYLGRGGGARKRFTAMPISDLSSLLCCCVAKNLRRTQESAKIDIRVKMRNNCRSQRWPTMNLLS